MMLNNKSDFILEYNEKVLIIYTGTLLDWSHSRIIFVSPSLTTKKIDEIVNFHDIPFELWVK